MPKKALAHTSGRLEIPADGQEFPVHPAIGTWIDVADNITPDTHEHVGGVVRLKQVPALGADKSLVVKAEAGRRILARYADWKQANMTARGVELVKLRVLNGAWTANEQTEVNDLQSAWDWIKAVRAASDAIEADAAVTTAAQVAGDPRWPT